MLILIKVEGEDYIGEYPVFVEGCEHQPNQYGIGGYVQYFFNENDNREIFANSYNICPPYDLPFPLPDFSVRGVPSEYTSYYIYVLQDAYYYGQPIWFDRYYGTLDKYIYKSDESPQLKPYGLNVAENGNFAYYHYLEVARFVSKYKYYRTSEAVSDKFYPIKPNYKDLVMGYGLDSRGLPDKLRIVPTKTVTVEISYYRDTGNPHPFTAIEWMVYTCDLVKGKSYTLPIINPTLGTMYVSDSELIQLINSINKAGKYPYKYLFEANLPELFAHWNSLHQTELNKPLPPPAHNFDTITRITQTYQTEINRELKCLGGNNDIWHNKPQPTLDIGSDLSHPLWVVDKDRAYEWWFAPQLDGSFGSIIMHNPKIDEIHKALNAPKYAINDLDSSKDRVTDLGFLVNRIAEVLGIRLNANGQINVESEKTKTRHLVTADEQIDQDKYGGNSYGSEGTLVRRLPNYFENNSIKSGGIVQIHDLTQLMLEILDQLNLAIGLQESGAIEINHGGTVHRYPSLLALVTEIAVHQFTQSSYAKSTHISSLVTQEQTKEIIGGLGLPTVSKTLLRTANGNKAAIPYWGIAPQASLAKKIDTCTYNVGIVLGQLI
jgi:hypothetical protein